MPKQNCIEKLEVVFFARNYLHLTGLLYTGRGGAKEFYRKCIQQKLSPHEIAFKKDGTTPLKLQSINIFDDFFSKIKFVGDYNQSRISIMCDKVAGNIYEGLGFVCDRSGNLVPETLLKEDARNLIRDNSQLIAVLEKKLNDTEFTYNKICRINERAITVNLKLPDYIVEIISDNVVDKICFKHK